MAEEIKTTPSQEQVKTQEAKPKGSSDPQKQEEVKKTESQPIVKKETKKNQTKTEEKPELERTYVVPLRRGFKKVPEYKRAKKAIKVLKTFIAKHMKVEDRDERKVKINMYLNNEIWFRGIRKPLHKVKVNAKKINGIVYVELAEIPEVVQYTMNKHAKRKTKVDKKQLDKVITQEAAEEKTKEARKDNDSPEEAKEKAKATVQAGEKANKASANKAKHTTKAPDAKVDKMSQTTKRKVLKK